jgi:tetratricopeptide (TPR) repeat protein
VKKHNWLNVAEYLLLVGSGVGSLAAIASQQVLFTAAPMSVLFLLNLINRQRIEESAQETTATSVSHLDHKLSHDITSMQQQVQALPNFMDLAVLRKAVTTQNQEALTPLAQEIEQLKQEMAKPEWGSLRQDIHQLQGQYAGLTDSVSSLTGYLNRLCTTNRVETLEQSLSELRLELSQLRTALQSVSDDQRQSNSRALQDQINHLNRRLSQLPTPFDASALKQDVESLLKVIGDLAPRRDLSQVEMQLEQINQQNSHLEQSITPLKVATAILKKQLDTVAAKLNTREQLSDQLLSTALQSQMSYLMARVDWAENHALDVQAQVDGAVKAQLDKAIQTIQANQVVPEYSLVFDVKGLQQVDANDCGSRTILEQVLESAQARLIVVLPHPTPEVLDQTMIQKFHSFLAHRGCLDIGWGHLGDISTARLPRSLDRRRALPPTQKGFLYDILDQFSRLKKQYPDQFRFKVLGTDEHFMVCDRSVAILGTQSITTSSVVFPKAAVGLRTTDPDVIQGLVDRFDTPSLDPQDGTAYFHRATTRYDLGDRAGAIADYTEVLRIHPNDDVAYNNRGLVHYDLGNRDNAIADFEFAIHHNPENAVAYCNLGLVRSELGDKLGAIEDYTCALQIAPDYSPAYFYRGLARTRLQNRLGAIQDYTEVIRLNPEDGTAYFYRGLAYLKIGYRIDAIQDLQQAAYLFSEQGDVANYQQTVNTIKKLHKTRLVSEPSKSMVS